MTFPTNNDSIIIKEKTSTVASSFKNNSDKIILILAIERVTIENNIETEPILNQADH